MARITDRPGIALAVDNVRKSQTNEQTKQIMHQPFVSTAPPPSGEIGDYEFSVLNALL